MYILYFMMQYPKLTNPAAETEVREKTTTAAADAIKDLVAEATV